MPTRLLGVDPKSLREVAHLHREVGPAGGVGPDQVPGHALVRGSLFDVIKVGVLPSSGVLMHRNQRYYGPLGLPLRTTRLHRRLIRDGSPRRRQRRRASHVPYTPFHACHSPYPAGTLCALRNQHRGRGLRRDMSGSAPGLFLFRGCRLHFMLRPAWLLPPKRLSTPRSGQGDLSPRLGPATRRSDAYRDGTSTRWVCAA